MRSILIVLALLAFHFGDPKAETPPPVRALDGLDPVLLVEGREAPGKEDLTLVRGSYRYFFVSTESKQRFERDATRYAIQMGGCCARMGPLSGSGSPDRFHVHEGRIYIFASEACRNAFKAAPERYLDQEDTPPSGSDEAKTKGRALLDQVVTGFGGSRKLDELKALQCSVTIAYRQGEKTTKGTRIVTFALPDRFRSEESWGTSTYGETLTAAGGTKYSGNKTWSLDEVEVDYLRRLVHRQPLVLAKARATKGFAVLAAGRGKVGDKEVELLLVAIHGATTMLSVEPGTGRVIQVAYRGRAGGSIGDVVKTYSDFRVVDGVTWPFKEEVAFDGNAIKNPTLTTEHIRINPIVQMP